MVIYIQNLCYLLDITVQSSRNPFKTALCPMLGLIGLVAVHLGGGGGEGGGGEGSPQCHGAAMPRGCFSNSPITQLLETSYSLKNSN